jgi:hypothetical protein
MNPSFHEDLRRAEAVRGSSDRGLGLTRRRHPAADRRIWLHDGYGAIELVLGVAGLCLIVTCSPGDPSVAMRVRHQETDDEKQPVQRGADHRRAA